MNFNNYFFAMNNSLESKNIFGISRKKAIKSFFKIKKLRSNYYGSY